MSDDGRSSPQYNTAYMRMAYGWMGLTVADSRGMTDDIRLSPQSDTAYTGVAYGWRLLTVVFTRGMSDDIRLSPHKCHPSGNSLKLKTLHTRGMHPSVNYRKNWFKNIVPIKFA